MREFFAKQALQRAQQFGETAEDRRRSTRTRFAYYLHKPGFWAELVLSLGFVIVFSTIGNQVPMTPGQWLFSLAFYAIVFAGYQYLCIRASSSRPRRKRRSKR